MKYMGVGTDRNWLIFPTIGDDKIASIPKNNVRIYTDEVPMADPATIEYFNLDIAGKWAYHVMREGK